MKYLLAYSALFAAVVAIPTADLGEKTCDNEQTVVCSGNGQGGLLSLGNILTGLLGQSCSGGDVYCCETGKVEQVSCISSIQYTLGKELIGTTFRLA